MRKKIYRYIFILSIISILVTTLFNMLSSYKLLTKQMEESVIAKTILLSNVLNTGVDYSQIDTSTLKDLRISVIENDGTVVYDSFKDYTQMDNHSDRPEVKQAFETGFGTSTRHSNTIGNKTFYVSVLLNNGNVLRVSKTTNEVYNVFKNTFPFTFLCIILSFIICHYIALILVKRLFEPLNNADINDDNLVLYDELAPLVKTIKNQKKELLEQFNVLESRTNTIKTITENIKEGIILLDLNKNILLTNTSLLNLIGLPNDNYINKNSLELIRDLSLQKSYDQALDGVSNDININFNNKTIQVLTSPVYQDGVINGTVSLFIDITQQANIDKIRREFSANVSHELKTPLTTILGLSELIYNNMVKKDDISIFGGKIKNESQRLLTLIDNIIKISQLDEKSFNNVLEEFSVTPVINDVVQILKVHLEEKNINIQINTNNEVISSNRQMFFELIFNLVENAIKYNNQDGSIIVNSFVEDYKTVIEVIDNGIGISEENQQRIFERFYRVDKSRNKKTGGSGLGLSIVKHIAGYINCEITLESELNKGSKFILKIN